MITLKRHDIRSISGGSGDTYIGKQFRDNLYYQLGYRQRRGDTIVVGIDDSNNATIINTKKEFQGVNAMYKAHGWLYRNRIRCSDMTAHIYLKETATLYPETEEQPDMKYSLKVLQRAAEIQTKKSSDYQNPNSRIKQADYYVRGCSTILDTMHAKVLRMQSVMEAMESDPNYGQNFESLEDSCIDLINYATFFASYLAGEMEGQKPDRDFLNRPTGRELTIETND
jgi:hypothetical protein